ncbi:hypothetical protein [Turicibacter sp. TJ11]|uniref:hypothetical protein n=1 Tax=Turicibacter sp. TJ11 TaxID=2806443 RepID=UPI001F34C665|nr:hypothetical protein [Turicibacter sp. TJ11]
MKVLKIIRFSLAIVIIGLLSLFAWGCVGGQYNQDVLNELTGQIIYTRRDTDSILKIYTAQANLENEQLLYQHQDSIDNGNVSGITYDKANNRLIFEAYDDTLEDWGLFELNEDGIATSLGISTLGLEEDWRVHSPTAEDRLYEEDGSLYLKDVITDESMLIKNFYGTYDAKFSPGYVPKALSQDETFVFFSYSKHLTPFGALLEGLLNSDYHFQTYVRNVKTGEESLYVNFGEIIFLSETDNFLAHN